MVSLADVEEARRALAEHVRKTPLRHSTTFSRLTGGEIHLKLENLQRTGSFKIRGAMNRLRKLPTEEAERGVIAASAGNHAQGVALAATTLGIRSTIVMPSDAPYAKASATAGYGAEVVLHGSDYDEAFAEAKRLQEEHGYTFIHAFNDADVIAGQGTVALEVYEDLPDVETVIVSVGGGGLISGVALAMKALKPDVRIIGVEAEGAASANQARAAGKIVTLDSVSTLADGIANRAVGTNTFELMQTHVDELVTVPDTAIAHAILMLLERGKTVVEGAGAAALAALLSGAVDVKGQKVACIVSGGNIDITLIGEILHRGLMEEGRILRFTTVIPDRPGHLKGIIDLLADQKGNLMRIHHDRELPTLPIDKTLVDVEVETRGPDHVQRILDALGKAGYAVEVQVGA